jgi:hypothetical protein
MLKRRRKSRSAVKKALLLGAAHHVMKRVQTHAQHKSS